MQGSRVPALEQVKEAEVVREKDFAKADRGREDRRDVWVVDLVAHPAATYSC